MESNDILFKFLYPKRIAVIGASRNPNKVGRIVFENLLQSGKEVIPINPNAEEITGIKCYPSVLDYPKEIDLAVICVRNFIVPKVLEECGKKGIKAVIIISAGFSEAGNQELEKELIEIANKYGIKFLGPNCFGIVFPKEKLNTTFMKLKIKEGKAAFISQSGALGAGLLQKFEREGIGIYAFISVGNQAVLTLEDWIRFFDKTDCSGVAVYMESTKNGRVFLDTLKQSKKKIFILKAGRTEKGSKAALTHTGAITTQDILYTAAIKQAKKVRVDSLEELVNLIYFLSFYEEISGKRVVVVTNSGGPAVILTDELESAGLELIDLPKPLLDSLNKILPPRWSHSNPIDLTGDATPERFKRVFELLQQHANLFNILICILTPLQMTQPMEVAKLLGEFKEKTGKMVIANFIGVKKEVIDLLERKNIPNFELPELISKTLKYLAQYTKYE